MEKVTKKHTESSSSDTRASTRGRAHATGPQEHANCTGAVTPRLARLAGTEHQEQGKQSQKAWCGHRPRTSPSTVRTRNCNHSVQGADSQTLVTHSAEHHSAGGNVVPVPPQHRWAPPASGVQGQPRHGALTGPVPFSGTTHTCQVGEQRHSRSSSSSHLHTGLWQAGHREPPREHRPHSTHAQDRPPECHHVHREPSASCHM
jgi:hypothetical protein